MGRLSELPPSERPRERLLSAGADTLEDDELLALVFGTGRGRGEDALELAARVIGSLGGLGALADTTPERLQRLPGLGPVKSARLVAALTLSERVAQAPRPGPLDDAALAARVRGQVPTAELALLAVDEVDPVTPPLTVSLGLALGPDLRPGSVLAQLLSAGDEGSWSLVFARPGGKPTRAEREAGVRLLSAASMLGVPIERFLLVSRTDHWSIGVEAS